MIDSLRLLGGIDRVGLDQGSFREFAILVGEKGTKAREPNISQDGSMDSERVVKFFLYEKGRSGAVG